MHLRVGNAHWQRCRVAQSFAGLHHCAMARDVAAELISLRRDLPPTIGMAARFGSEPAAGLLIALPEDENWSLEVVPSGNGWSLVEVHQLPGPLGRRRFELGDVAPAAARGAVAAHFRRLQVHRNAACGTPVVPLTAPAAASLDRGPEPAAGRDLARGGPAIPTELV